ncbi:MAG: MerR family transcriptional regulator [Rhodospirillaceae bacterium]|jgi:DNA-binding transcriptional MerR regulator|nr:MerR family transcriptional regulator [Rhodospirillaceae bacterium]MBT5665480.1 MerR family transcriptional regulator [Rhodospirillaceae bacterium]
MADVAEEADLQNTKGRKQVIKSPTAFRTISEVATELEIPQHVLRFWETKFTQVKPMKRGGGRRYYRPGDIELIRAIRELLYRDGYTIRGVQRLLRENGAKALLQDKPDEQSTPRDVDAGAAAGATALSKVAPDGNDRKQALREILNELTNMRDVLKTASSR